MTRLAATLGTSGIAAAFLLAAFQLLPSRDGGAAQAGTQPALAWADPPRTRPAPTVTAPETAEPVRAAAPPAETRTADIPAAAVPAPPARRDAGLSRAARHDHGRRLAAQVRGPVEARAVPGRFDRVQDGPTVRTASARLGGPVGDILHGLGLD